MESNENLETNSSSPNYGNSMNSSKPKTWIGWVILAAVTFVVGVGIGNQQLKFQDGRPQVSINKGPDRNADYTLFWNALDLVNSKYVDRGNLDQKKLLYGAIQGMMTATGDPYTVFFDPEASKQFSDQLKGSFDGIGAQMDIKDQQIIIVAPLDDSPAGKAGILAGDILLGINGESTAGMNLDAAIDKIRGPKGTQVTLSVLHPKQTQATDIAITRDTIKVPSVKLTTKEINGKKIAVMDISQFGDDTKGLFNHDIDVIAAGNFDGLIIDLRNNPGGYLDASVALASAWVDDNKVVVKEVNYQGDVKNYNASGLARLKGMKTVVLVNGGSASASEILAGALQDYKLATLIGEKTFGKGSVQELQDLAGDTSVKITVAKWHTPNDRSIDKNGLEPDVKVELKPEDVTNKVDPQMDKALDLLK